jgi:hypothetical protein
MTLVFIFSIVSVVAFAQESNIIKGPPVTTPTVSTGTDIEWLWGEAILVDAANNQITVKYLDYETDTEKEMVIGVDEKTTYENAASLNEVSAGENVSIDYYIDPEGKKIAKNISLEKAASSSAMQKESTAVDTSVGEVSVNAITVPESAPSPESADIYAPAASGDLSSPSVDNAVVPAEGSGEKDQANTQ